MMTITLPDLSAQAVTGNEGSLLLCTLPRTELVVVCFSEPLDLYVLEYLSI